MSNKKLQKMAWSALEWGLQKNDKKVKKEKPKLTFGEKHFDNQNERRHKESMEFSKKYLQEIKRHNKLLEKILSRIK